MITLTKIKEIIEANSKAKVTHKSKLGRQNRDLFIILCRKYTDATPTDVSIFLDVSNSIVLNAKRNYKILKQKDHNFKIKAKKIKHIIWTETENLKELTPNFSYVKKESKHLINLSHLPDNIRENVMERMEIIVKMESLKVMNYRESVKV